MYNLMNNHQEGRLSSAEMSQYSNPIYIIRFVNISSLFSHFLSAVLNNMYVAANVNYIIDFIIIFPHDSSSSYLLLLHIIYKITSFSRFQSTIHPRSNRVYYMYLVCTYIKRGILQFFLFFLLKLRACKKGKVQPLLAGTKQVIFTNSPIDEPQPPILLQVCSLRVNPPQIKHFTLLLLLLLLFLLLLLLLPPLLLLPTSAPVCLGLQHRALSTVLLLIFHPPH